MGSAGGRGPGMTQPGAMMGQMEQRIKAMQELRQQILNATTPEERRKVMEEGRRKFLLGMTMTQLMMDEQGMTTAPKGSAPAPAK